MHANRLMPNVYRKKLLAFTIIFLIVTGCTEGNEGENEYGPDPVKRK